MKIDELTMQFDDQLIDLPTLYNVIDTSPLTISLDSYVVDAVILMSQERSHHLQSTTLNFSSDSSCDHQQETSCILVVDKGKVVGIITDKDIIQITADGKDLSLVKIAEVMVQPVITLTLTDSQDIFTALSALRQHQIHHLPIVDEQGQLLGIVNEASLLKAFDLMKMVGVVAALQQHLQDPKQDLQQSNQQIEAVRRQTYSQIKHLVEAQSAEIMQVNQELQQTLEELQVVEEELRQQNEELAAARELTELERQRYRDLFDLAPDGYLVTDTAGIIQEVNHAAARMLGVSQDFLLGKPLILFIAKQDQFRFSIQLKNLEQLQDWEINIKPRKSPSFPANIKVSAVYNLQGQRVGCRWLLRNISDVYNELRLRKQAEAALRQATEELEQRVAERTAELVVANRRLQQEIAERQRAEEALRQSEKLYRQLVESQTDLIIRVDLHQQITFANTAACQTLGRQLDELCGQSLLAFLHPDDVAQGMLNLTTLISPPHQLTIEEQRLFTVNGIRWFQWNMAAIKDEAGNVLEIQGVGRDITERKQMEAALRESEEKFRLFADHTQALIWIESSDSGRILYVNGAYERIWGRDRQSLEAKPDCWMNAVVPEDRDRVMAMVEQYLQGEQTDIEYRILRPDGQMCWVWSRCFSIWDEQGNIRYYAGIVEDITERKQMEEALRTSEEKFRWFADNTQAVIWILDPGTRKCLYVNPAYDQVWGRSRHNLIAEDTAYWISTLHPEDRDRLQPVIEQHLSSGNVDLEYRILLPDGTIRWIWDRCFAMRDEQGNIRYYAGMAEDITERKQAEESLRQSEEKFRQYAQYNHALVWIADPDSGDNLYVNPAYEQIWGRSCQSLRQQPDSWLEAIHPEDCDLVMDKIQRQKRGESTDLEYRIVRPDGTIRWIWDRGFAMRDEQGKIYSYGGIAEDITERKQAEESLRQSEARLSLALEAAHMGIWDWNLQNNEAYWSPNMGPLLGLPSSSCCPGYEEFINLIYPEDRDFWTEALGNLAELEAEYAIEFRVVWPDGSIHWLIGRGQVYHNELGQPVRIIGTTRDISDRKQAEAALRESEERYRLVVTGLQEGIVIHQADGRIIGCNPSAENILGLGANLIIGRTCDDPIWHTIQEDGSDFVSEAHPAMVTLRTGQPCSNVVMGIYKLNGQLTWISINSQPLFRDNESNPYGVVSSFTDISDRKQAEQKIREQAALLDVATDAIFVRDLQTQIILWNKGAERLYGWQADEALGQNLSELLYTKTASVQAEAALKAVIESGSWQGELKNLQKSGKEIIVESRWTLVHDAAEQPKSILIVDTDITQKKHLEEQFFRAQRMESLGTLAGGIAHDLNNILTPILAASQLLEPKFAPDPERYEHLLGLIASNAKRGAALVKQVLSFARGFKGERTIVQLKHLIGEITLIVKQTFPKSIDFTATMPEDLWPISGDITQLHQVLMNLVVNARDAMPDGGIIKISAENIFIDEAYVRMNLDAKVGYYVMMTVADTGIGMPQAVLDKIFEPFFTTKDVGAGTGLGLSTVLGIVKSHGGFINVSSQVDKGSQFTLFLPAAQVAQTPDTNNIETPTGNGEMILVVEDEAQIREITNLILKSHNYQTLIASNGIEAIALYAQHKHQINAVLMDMMMPEMDGLTAIRTIQKMKPQVPIIACSGMNPTEALSDNSVNGVQFFLPKPFTAKELLNSLHHVLTGLGIEDESQQLNPNSSATDHL